MDIPVRSKEKKKSSRLSLPQNRVRQKNLRAVTDLDVYDFEKVIGEGKFSDVVRAVNKETGEVCAVKVIDKKKIDDDRTLRKLETEVKIQAACNHPNILRLTGVYDDEDTRCLFMELAEGGDLFDKIIEKVVFTEEEAKVVVRQILRALVYLHSRNIAHRDLKPENILYMTDDDDSAIVLADFGFAKQATSKEEILGTPCGTINYAAPEIVDCEYNISVDLWAVGCISYFLLFGIPPFYSEADDDDEVMDQLMEAKDNPDAVQFPEDAPCSKEAKQFIKALLNPIAAKRPSASDALQHPWMMKHHLDDDEDLDSSVNEIWESFKQLRIATMSEDPEERRKQLNRIMSVVAVGGRREDEDDDNNDLQAPKKSPAGARKQAAEKDSSRRGSRRMMSSMN